MTLAVEIANLSVCSTNTLIIFHTETVGGGDQTVSQAQSTENAKNGARTGIGGVGGVLEARADTAMSLCFLVLTLQWNPP